METTLVIVLTLNSGKKATLKIANPKQEITRCKCQYENAQKVENKNVQLYSFSSSAAGYINARFSLKPRGDSRILLRRCWLLIDKVFKKNHPFADIYYKRQRMVSIICNGF